MNVNSNEINLAQYKGEVKPCPLCGQRSRSAAVELILSGKACVLCMDQKFVAICTNCDGSGIFRGRTVWDGGRSEHSSTCSPCGGKGVFPTRRPKDWVDRPSPPSPPEQGTITAASDPIANIPPQLPPPITMSSGTIMPGGVAVK